MAEDAPRIKRAKRLVDPNSLYFVQLREAERKILRDAIEYNGGVLQAAADMLGLTKQAIWHRAKLLGGVFDKEQPREPFPQNASRRLGREIAREDAQSDLVPTSTTPKSRRARSASASTNGAAHDPDVPKIEPGDGAAIERTGAHHEHD